MKSRPALPLFAEGYITKNATALRTFWYTYYVLS
jgi:hypothetical protein